MSRPLAPGREEEEEDGQAAGMRRRRKRRRKNRRKMRRRPNGRRIDDGKEEYIGNNLEWGSKENDKRDFSGGKSGLVWLLLQLKSRIRQKANL